MSAPEEPRAPLDELMAYFADMSDEALTAMVQFMRFARTHPAAARQALWLMLWRDMGSDADEPNGHEHN
jgi:hypothetical protein